MNDLLTKVLQPIINPYRQDYSIYDLGQNKDYLPNGQPYSRIDFSLSSHRIINSQPFPVQLLCSLYTTTPSTKAVIYCHTNSGSRLEAMQGNLHIQALLLSYSFLSFDFANCGMSSPLPIPLSLGHHEQNDLQQIVHHLVSLSYNHLVFWGRSMGAVTIQLYLQSMGAQPTSSFLSLSKIDCVLDSSFASFQQMIYVFSASKAKLSVGWTGVIKSCMNGVLCIEEQIEQLMGFNLIELDVLRNLLNYKGIHSLHNVLFVASEGDTLLKLQTNSLLLYQGMKQTLEGKHVNVKLMRIDKDTGGDHNMMRDEQTIDKIIQIVMISNKHFILVDNWFAKKPGDYSILPENEKSPLKFRTTNIGQRINLYNKATKESKQE